MGGSIKRGYGDLGFGPPSPRNPNGTSSMTFPPPRNLFASGVPSSSCPSMPPSSTRRGQARLPFSQGTALNRRSRSSVPSVGPGNTYPLRPMTIAFLVNPSLCPVQPMHIRIDEKGFTRPEPGPPKAPIVPNAQVASIPTRLLFPLLSQPRRRAVASGQGRAKSRFLSFSDNSRGAKCIFVVSKTK